MISNIPDTTCIQKPTHIRGYNLLSGAIGSSRATPRSRKSITALAPTSNPMPIACHVRMNQYANTDGESRIHMLRELSSRVCRNRGTAKLVSLSPGFLVSTPFTTNTYREVVLTCQAKIAVWDKL